MSVTTPTGGSEHPQVGPRLRTWRDWPVLLTIASLLVAALYLVFLLATPAAHPGAGEGSAEAGHDHGHGHGEEAGVMAGFDEALISTARLLPLVPAPFLVAWLLADAAARRRRPESAARPSDWLARPLRVAAVVGLVGSAALHAGLTPDHFEEGVAFGVFFVVSTVATAAAAGVLVASPTPRATRFALFVSVALILVYALFRLVPPPTAAEPERLDAIGVLTKLFELVAGGALWVGLRGWRPSSNPAAPNAG